MIRRIKRELALTNHYLNHPSILNLYLFKELFRIMQWVLFGVIIFLIAPQLLPVAPNFTKRVFQLGMMVLGFATGRASANITFAKSLIDSDDHKKRLLAKLATLESALPPVEASGQ